MKSLRHIACGAALAAVAVPATAATVDDLMAEMRKMEARHQQEMKVLKAQLNKVESQRQASQPAAVNQRVEELEKKIAESDAKAKKRDAAVKRSIEEQREKLQVHGFASAYVVNGDKNVDSAGIGLGDDEQFRSDTMAGVQFDYKVNDTVDAVLQLTANGYEDYSLDAEWAFLRFKLQDNWMVRAGRLRSPTYMYSESMDVGYTYPWARPPLESYLVGLSNYDGVDTIYSFNAGSWNHALQFMVGTMDESTTDYDVEIRDRWGVTVTSTTGPWTLRGSYTDLALVLESDSLGGKLDAVDIYYASLGARYDDGQWLAIAEAVDFGADDVTPVLTNTSAYFTLGYRVGKVMPYASYAVVMSGEDDEDRVAAFYDDRLRAGFAQGVYDAAYAQAIAGGANGAVATATANGAQAAALASYDAADHSKSAMRDGINVPGFGSLPGVEVMQESKSITLGVRYDVLDNVALKLESAYYYDMNNTLGVFDNYDGSTGYSDARSELGDSQQVVSFGVDAVF